MDYLSEELYFEAANIANELASQTGQFYSKKIYEVKCFDIQKYVAATESVEFIEYPFKKHLRNMMLGSTTKIFDQVIITTNTHMMLERKNFTNMHEIIHYYRDVPYAEDRHTFSDMIAEDGYLPEDYAKEYRANVGAAILLANDEALYYALKKFSTFQQVADYFFMSKSALHNRLKDYLVYVKNCSPNHAASLINNYRYNDQNKFYAAMFRNQ